MAEIVRGEKSPPKTEAEPEHGAPTQAEQMARVARWGLPVATLAAAGIVGTFYGVGTAILVLAGGVLLGVIAILWESVRTLSGDAPITLEEAIALGSPSATEEQKRAVLQALKDLEYERSVGKVAEADYEELHQRYRTEAKRLLRAVDEDLAPLRARAQEYLTRELGRPETPPDKKAPEKGECRACQSDNDADAVFCKKCGGKLDASKEPQGATV
jgi:hypothetical protein